MKTTMTTESIKKQTHIHEMKEKYRQNEVKKESYPSQKVRKKLYTRFQAKIRGHTEK